MRPIDELTGQLLDVFSVEELEAEAAERKQEIKAKANYSILGLALDPPQRPISPIIGSFLPSNADETLRSEYELYQSEYEQWMKENKKFEEEQERRKAVIAKIEQLSREITSLEKEISRISMRPETPPYPDCIDIPDYKGFYFGIEYGKTLRQWENINKRHEKVRESKLFAIRTAKKAFDGNRDARIGEVARHILAQLKEKKMHCPSVRSIKDWLNNADKDGLLNIPPQAHRKGR